MKVLLYILVALIAATCVSAADFAYNINYSSLPFIQNELVTIRYIENKTLNVSYGSFTSGNTTLLNFSNTNMTQFEINIDVPIEMSPGQYNDSVMLYNYDDNFTSNITFFINITDDITNNTNSTNNSTNNTNTPTVDFVQIDLNQFEYTICDYMQPWNKTKIVTVAGRAGQTVYTNHDTNFFDVPTSFVIPDANYSEFEIKIHLKNLSVGTYVRDVNFSVISNYSYVRFRFVIQTCLRPPPTYEDVIAVCSIVDKTPAEALECQRLQAEYNQQLYEAMLEASEKKIVNNTVTKYVNVTERLPVLDLNDPEIVQALKDIPITWKQMIVDARAKDERIDQLAEDARLKDERITQLGADFDKKLKDELQLLIDENTRKANTIDLYEEQYIKKSTIWTWIVLVSLVVGGVIFFLWWWNDQLY